MFSLIQSFDDFVLQTLAASRIDVLTDVLSVVSFLGEWYVLLPAAAIIVLVLARSGLVVQATEFAYAVIGTSIAVAAIKFLIDRPRPPESFRIAAESGYSFPSWHAAAAIAFWGYLAFLAAKRVRNPALRVAIIVLCLVIIITTVYSRLYLGAHYFSDVVMGALLGGLVLLIAL